jgi:hypothetical protein
VSINFTSKIVMCYAPADAKEKPPRVELPMTIGLAIKAGVKGLIFATYDSNLLDSLVDCDGYMPCVLVDFEIAQRIISYAKVAAG